VHQIYAQALHLLNAVWHRRWAALGAAWLVALLGWVLVVSQPNIYTSSARIFIDATSIMKPLLEGLAIDWDVNLDPEVMKQTLTTRANLEQVARMTDLDLTATGPDAMERLINAMRSRTTFQNEGVYLLRLSYTDGDPVRAQEVAQALTEVFLASSLGHSREKMEAAQAFLDRQIAAYQRELEVAENSLATFKQERLSTLPSRQSYQFEIEQLGDELAEAEAGLARAQAQQARLGRDLNAGPTSDTALEIFQTEQALEELLTRYTERHPDVTALQRKLAALRGEPGPVDGEQANAAVRRRAPQRASLIDYDEVKFQLSQADADAAVYASRVESLRSRLDRLEERAAQIPGVEMELARLTRDHDVLKIKHGELLARREQARLAHEREIGTDQVEYQVVEPPHVPVVPDGPPRGVLISLVLFAAIGSGAALAFVLVHINECFSDPSQLRRAFSLPVLGTVSAVQSRGQRTWRVAEVSSFVGAFALLVVVYGAVLATEARIGWSNVVPAEMIGAFYDRARS
jgi:polysaccharide chain length determinant protein (PEP-CTERM system associated)